MLVEGHRPLPAEGVKCTSVQNPLASLRAEAARLAIAALPGPTVLAGHSGMIVTDLAVDPKVTALVYVAARHPMRARTIRRWRRPIRRSRPQPHSSDDGCRRLSYTDDPPPRCCTRPTGFCRR